MGWGRYPWTTAAATDDEFNPFTAKAVWGQEEGREEWPLHCLLVGGLPPCPGLLSASFPFLVVPGWSHLGSWAVAEEPGSQQSKRQGSGFLFQLWTGMSVPCALCNNWSHTNSTVSEPVHGVAELDMTERAHTHAHTHTHTHTSWVIWVCDCVLSHVWFFATQWTVAHQASLSVEFSRQEYWSGFLFPFPEDLPDPGIEPVSLVSPALADEFFTTATPGNIRLYLGGP